MTVFGIIFFVLVALVILGFVTVNKKSNKNYS